MAQGFSLFQEALLGFEAQDPNIEQDTKVAQPFRTQSSATSPAVLRKKEPEPRRCWVVFSRGDVELNPASTSVMSEAARLPSISCCWQSFIFTISHLLSFLQSVALLACSLDACPCMCQLLYWTSELYKVIYCKVTIIFSTYCVF